VRFDPVGERIWLVDDTGARIDEDRALLVMLDLVAAEKRGGQHRPAGDHHPGGRTGGRLPRRPASTWVSTAPDQLTRACSEKETIFGGDGAADSSYRSSTAPWTASPASPGCSAWSRART
jgi:mannose-1-phosphate guanylyltransferase/phosphomannomutase